MIGRHAPKALDVSGGVDLGASRHVSRIGALAAWRLAGMDLHQFAPQVQLERRGVESRPQRSPDQVVRHRVDRLVDFDMEVAVDLGIGPLRRVEGCARAGQEQREFLGPEGLEGSALGSAVNCASRRGSHQVSARTRQSARSTKDSPARESALDVVHDALDALACRSGRPYLAASITKPRDGAYSMKASLIRWRGVLGGDDDRLHVVGDDDGEYPAEVAPGGLEPSDDLFGRLEETLGQA